MDVPGSCYYTRDHLWVRPAGNEAEIGVTDFYQEELGDVILVDLPDVEDEIEMTSSFGVLKSDKAVVDLTAPVSGEIVEVNADLVDSPELVNEDPYGEGWLLKIEISEPGQMESLMTPGEYESYIADLGGGEE
ncbi:MAG: glycine cleavage system protein GcvH [Deltaproteobacteria bacterium]|nr:glycine cleavage system protein GcvH [Deltaproteobacteria bacterium]